MFNLVGAFCRTRLIRAAIDLLVLASFTLRRRADGTKPKCADGALMPFGPNIPSNYSHL
jgi:hypothetical protein